MSQGFTSTYSYPEFAGWFKDTIGIQLEKVEWASPGPGPDGYRVQVIVDSTDRSGNSIDAARYREVWTLKRELGWKIDRFEGNQRL
jgi:hypothetical protein